MTKVNWAELIWRALLAITALSLPFSFFLVIFESLFVGFSLVWPTAPNICRFGAGIWAGTFGAICSTVAVSLLCRRKGHFDHARLVFLYVSVCVLAIITDAILIVLETVCLNTQIESPLPLYQLAAGTGHIICTILMVVLMYIYRKYTLEYEKEKETSKLSPHQYRRTIVIPNIIKAHPNFVSVDLTK